MISSWTSVSTHIINWYESVGVSSSREKTKQGFHGSGLWSPAELPAPLTTACKNTCGTSARTVKIGPWFPPPRDLPEDSIRSVGTFISRHMDANEQLHKLSSSPTTALLLLSGCSWITQDFQETGFRH